MNTLLRRGRGLLTAMVVWSVPWAVLGLAIGVAYRSGLLGSTIVVGPEAMSLTLALTLAGLVIGAVNGLVFGLLLMLAERNHAIAELRASRIGAWGALASAATAYIVLSSPTAAVIAALLGFLGGALALRVAQGPRIPLSSEHEALQ